MWIVCAGGQAALNYRSLGQLVSLLGYPHKRDITFGWYWSVNQFVCISHIFKETYLMGIVLSHPNTSPESRACHI